MLSDDHFELFQLAPRFALDASELDRAYQDVQSRVHPDRFASRSPAERRVAMQWAARANEAYRTLKSPLLRAAYLCERAGVPIEAETNTAMAGDFLTQQLEWREALEAAGAARDDAALARLAVTLEGETAHLIGELADAIDWKSDFPRAAALVRKLMFLDRFRDEIEIAMESLPTTQRASA
ncbi:MAG: Fe-S protein assembly co-chaperone HscB [Burkholderiaceae bacterium]